MRADGTISIFREAAAGIAAALILFSGAALLSSRIAAERRSASHGTSRAQDKGGLLADISRRPPLAFGFRNLLGDVAWLKAVQVSGSGKLAREDYDRLYILLDTSINFDPRFTVPYLLGGIILGDSPDHTREALEVLARGKRNHPSEWRFPFFIGYIRYFSLGDPLGGGEAIMEASRVPGSAKHLPLLAARMLSEGREPGTALAFLEEMMRHETNPGRREALVARIREVMVERDIQALERAAEEYRRRAGSHPDRLQDLAEAGLIRSVPREPHGGSYYMASDGRVHSNKVTARLKVFRNK